MEVVVTANARTEPAEQDSEDTWSSVIARSLALLAMSKAEVEKKIGAKAKFLASLGLPKRDIAVMLNTTQETVRVELAKAMKSGRSRLGKRKSD